MKSFFYTMLFVPTVLFGQVDNLLNLTDSLVAKYTFNGNVLDVSGNGNHATINTAELTTDRFGNLGAYEFNNSNIEIENQFFDNSWGNYTISVWFLIDDLSKSMQTIFNTIPHDGESISFNHENEPQKLSHWKTKTVGDHQWSTFGGTGNPFYDGVEENTWYFLTVVKNGFEFDYYINGNLIQTTIISESNHSGLASLRFGNIGTSSMEYLSGKIDDFSLWNRSLTQSEILDVYNAEEDCVEETFVGEYYYYDNDSATSDYCNDISNFTYDNESNELIWHFDQNGTIDDNLNNSLSYIRCNDSIQINGAQNTILTKLDNGWLVGCANGSTPVVLIEAGCTNEIALNYNENAYIDNNTCEFYSGPDWYVSVQGTNEIGFGDEEHPFASIQYAIDASNNGDTVYVQSGTYYENLNFNGKNINLIGEDNLTTIIEAEYANSRIVTFNSGENATCVLSGFTLSNNSNGAISVVGANPTLQNLIIKGNSANNGGGIYVNDSQGLTINNCELSENSSSGHGGAVSIWYNSNVSINNSTFTNNESQTGGGVYSFNSSLDINYSIFNLNVATGDGGGITISSTSNSQLDMVNNTMHNNSAVNDPQSNGIRLAGSGSSANITNSIIWENISGDNFSITYSNIQGQGDDNFEIDPGEGNIAQIPLFNSVDSSNPDYNLTVCSPCIDAGNPEETDPDGSIIDMGALPFITQGYNCDGNIDVEIGDEVFGGVVFYVGEGSDGQYGLVASTDYIGTGTWQQAFDQSASYENNGYTDWYLPYMHELSMIYNELHSTGSNVYNTGDVNNWYWSSEVCDSSSSASDVHFTDGSYNICNNMSSSMGGVIVIHSFGSVEYGCIDSLAFNYSSEFANLDDGSCYPVIEGCLDTTAFNYAQPTDDVQIDVNTDDGSCYAFVYGCLDTESFNFNDIDGDGQPNALTGINGIDINTDDGSCYPVIEGCLDTTAFNYAQPTDDVQIDVNTDDGSCYPVIEGCMGPIAENYISPIGDLQLDVNTEDGSCLYSSLVYEDLTELNSDLEESLSSVTDSLDNTLTTLNDCSVENDQLEEDLSVFETVEEEQDYSMSFDGVDDYVYILDNSSYNFGTSDFSISGWFKTNDSSGVILSNCKGSGQSNPNNNSWYIIYIEDGKLAFEFTDGYSSPGDYVSCLSNEIVNDNNWHYFTVTFDRSEFGSIYLDGLYSSSSYIGDYGGSISPNDTINIGYDTNHMSYFLDGEISNIQTWNIALSSSQIQSYMICPPTVTQYGLVGFLNFNEGVGDTVYDLSGNGNHGIINGATFTEDVPVK
jgi:hypothetical protein